MAIELTPTTISGYAQRRYCRTSTRPYSAARIKQHQPVENSAHEGVQRRFTDGHTLVAFSNQPTASPPTPARARICSFRFADRDERSSSPHISPKIIVASEGRKFRV